MAFEWQFFSRVGVLYNLKEPYEMSIALGVRP